MFSSFSIFTSIGRLSLPMIFSHRLWEALISLAYRALINATKSFFNLTFCSSCIISLPMIFSYHPLYPLLSLGYRYILFVAFSIFAPTPSTLASILSLVLCYTTPLILIYSLIYILIFCSIFIQVTRIRICSKSTYTNALIFQ